MAPEAVIAGLLTLLGATWSALIAGFFRGDLVPGHVYRREVKRADTATTQAERNATSIGQLAKAHEQERESHGRDIADLRRQLAEAHRAPNG